MMPRPRRKWSAITPVSRVRARAAPAAPSLGAGQDLAVRRRSTEIPRVDLILANQSVQRWTAHGQKPRPLGDVPARLGESVHQGVPLRAIPGLSERGQIGAVLDFDAEVPCLDEFRPGHENSSLHRVLELANVAGPGIVENGLESRAREAELSPVLLVAALEERVGDEHDVLAPVTQRREREVHDRQAIVEVFTEPPGL